MATAVASKTPAVQKPRDESIPLLENGDKLTASEFLRRYEAMPEVKKAELINGRVYMASPVRFVQHGQYDGHIQTWVGYYCLRTPGLSYAPNATARLGVDDVPQPDAMLIVDPNAGGTAQIDSKGYLFGAPELVIEVAASSASIDFTEKFDLYRRANVKEYLLLRTQDRIPNWWELKKDSYEPIPASPEGIIQSRIFPGLWLDTSALIHRDGARLLDTLQRGMASPEYLAFAADLKKRMSKA